MNEASQINNKNFKNFFVKAVGLIQSAGSGREDFSYPEYDLEEIKQAAESDSYIKQALSKYTYLIYKAGYTIKSENEAASEYIKTRFRIMSFATEKPMDILLQEISDDLMKFSNAFLVKSRVDNIMKSVKVSPVFGNKPVGGYYRVDPSLITIKRNDSGQVIGYKQTVNGKEKTFNKQDVIHFYMDKDPNNAFGTPRISAALEDVKLLRRIEGNVISLIYRFSIPIYHWIVGLPQTGMQATDPEIEDLKTEIESMALDGSIVTNERTQIKTVGAEGSALDASNYLKYFEQRVFTALGVSESQMGRGGSKKDADSMEAQAHDVVKHVQRTMSIFIENYIINELLLEGGFDPIMNEDDIVHYVFNEISLETKVKLENHEILKFQSNVTSLEETRRSLGRKEEVDEERLYANIVTKDTALETIDKQTEGSINILRAQAEEDRKTAQQGAQLAANITQQNSDGDQKKNNGNGKVAANKPNGAVENNNRPENQHGKTSVKIAESLKTKGEFLSRNIKDAKDHKKIFQSVYKKYDTLSNDVNRGGKDIEIIFKTGEDSINKSIHNYIELASQDGINRAIKDHKKEHDILYLKRVSISLALEQSDDKVNNLLNDIANRVKKGENVKDVFAVLEYRLRFLLEHIMPKTYWYSYAQVSRQLGTKKVYVNFNGSDDKDLYPGVIDTSKINFDEIPAYHPFCDCQLTTKEGEK